MNRSLVQGTMLFVTMVVVPVAWGDSAISVGAEFQVNTYTTDNQGGYGALSLHGQAVCSDAAGNFIAVWQSHNQDQADNGTGIFGQRYNSAGALLGTEFQLNTTVFGFQDQPALICGSNGFVSMWRDSTTSGITGQRYDSAGAAQGTEFPLSGGPHYADNKGVSACAGASGDFVVVWASYEGPPFVSYDGVFGRRFDSTGAPLGTEFQVNAYTTGRQEGQSVACDSAGNFIVVWASGDYSATQDGSSAGIMARRYDSTGAALGTEFVVNTYTTGSEYLPSVSSDPAGNFVVVWGAPPGAGGTKRRVRGQRFDSTGAPQGAEFQVNSQTTRVAAIPQVARASGGGFVVVWGSYKTDPNDYNVYGQLFDSTGNAQGSEFQANTYTTQQQRFPKVAYNADAHFMVTWLTYGNQDGDGMGVFGQRFGVGPAHDAVVQPVAPVNVTIAKSTTPPPKIVKVKVKVRNVDPVTELPGDSITLTAGSNCPGLVTVGTPDFDPSTPLTLEDTATIAGGKTKTATVLVTIHSTDFLTYNAKAPNRCTLTFSASTNIANNIDPVPSNNVATAELNVVDKNDVVAQSVHESVLKSLAPAKVNIGKQAANPFAKVVHPVVVNADFLAPAMDVDPGHSILVSVDLTACPWITSGTFDMDGPTPGDQSSVTVKAGKSVAGKLQLLTDAGAVQTKNPKSPMRCTATLSAFGPGGEHEVTNNTTKLTVDVIDKHDF